MFLLHNIDAHYRLNIDYILNQYMPIINFSIPTALDKKIKEEIKKQGFASKAEFFRFSAMLSMNYLNDRELNKTVDELKSLISKKFGGKNLPSIEEQLEDF